MFNWKPFNFSGLLRDEVFLDCVLLTSDKKYVKTHKSVLCAVSPYLKTILSDQEMVNETFVTLNDFRYEDVVNFINFIYHGESLLTNEEAKEVVNILDFFQVPFNGEKPNTFDIKHGDNGSDYHSSFVDCSDNRVHDETCDITCLEKEPIIVSVTPVTDEYRTEEELPAMETVPMPGSTSVPESALILTNPTIKNPNIQCVLVPGNPGSSTSIYFVADVNHVQSIKDELQQSTIANANPVSINRQQRSRKRSFKKLSMLGSAKRAKLEHGKLVTSLDPNQGASKKQRTSGKTATHVKQLKNSKQRKAINLPKKEEIIEMLEKDVVGESNPSLLDSEEAEIVDSPNWGFDSDNEVDNPLYEETSNNSCASPSEPLYPCSLCTRSFTSDALEEHVQNCGQRRPKYSGDHPCPICGKCFTTKMSVRRHVKDLHGQLISYRHQLTVPTVIVEEIIKENAQEIIKENAQEIIKENAQETIKENAQEIIQENSGHHSLTTDSHKKPEALMCDLCGYLTRTQTKMQDHMNYHTGARPYLCEICSNTFLTKTALLSHKKLHMRERQIERKCKLCGLVFYNHSTFTCHMRRHQTNPDYKPTVTGQFRCRWCEKQFASRLSVKLHEQKAHRDGNKSNDANVCAVCKESFDNRFSLQQHMNEHRTYECKYCHKFFVTEWAMRTHQKHLRCKVISEQIKNGIPFVPEPTVKKNVKCKSCAECFTSAEYQEHKNGLCRGYVDPSKAHVTKRLKRYPKGWTPWQDVSKVVEDTEERVEEEVIVEHVNYDGADQTACISV